MGILSEEGERINPSLVDIKILIALSDHEGNAYQIARRVENDCGGDQPISNGAIRPAIARLCAIRLIEPHQAAGYFQLTDFGHTVLDIELKHLDQLTSIAKQRLDSR